MHDFGPLVYLEMQKSGSSYVNHFLKECCTLTEIKHDKHGSIKKDYDANNFYFITIRHPLDLYSSIYRYGLDRRGGLYNALNRNNSTTCYKSFDSFVQFLLDPHNAKVLDRNDPRKGYSENIAEQMGFMSYRFMKLSLRHPRSKIKNALESGKELIELERKFITDLEIKNEELNQGLKLLATEKFPEYFDKTSVNKFLKNRDKINASKTLASNLAPLPETTYSKLMAKEALLSSRY